MLTPLVDQRVDHVAVWGLGQSLQGIRLVVGKKAGLTNKRIIRRPGITQGNRGIGGPETMGQGLTLLRKGQQEIAKL